MHNKKLISVTCALLIMLMSAMPVNAGTWIDYHDDTWEYIDDEGESVTGWIEDEGNRYYLEEDGTLRIGWYKIKGSWYYFEDDGVMASDKWVDNYYVNSDGKWKSTK